MITRKNIEFLARYGSSDTVDNIMTGDHEFDYTLAKSIVENPNHSEQAADRGSRDPNRLVALQFIRKGKLSLAKQDEIIHKKFNAPNAECKAFGGNINLHYGELLSNPNLHSSMIDKIADNIQPHSSAGDYVSLELHPNLSDEARKKIKEKLHHDRNYFEKN